jgi:Ca2+/Na+ antiporter
MYPHLCLLVSAVIPIDQSGANNLLTLALLILGFLLIIIVLVVTFLFPSEKRILINELTYIEVKSIKLRVPFLELLFLGGLACIGACIYVSEPSRLVAALSPQLTDLNRENAALQAKLDEAQRQIENAKMVSVTLYLTAPPNIRLDDLDLGSLKCHYLLSDSRDFSIAAEKGMASQDVKCRIDNILPELVIVRVNLDQEIQATGKAKKVTTLAYRESIYPAKPNYHLCATSKTSCAEEDSWK